MKTGVIIVNGFWENESTRHQVASLTQAFAARGITVRTAKGNALLALIDGDSVRARLGEADFVVYLDKDLHVATMLEKAGYRLFNRAETMRVCDDKMLTYIALANEGFSLPKTLSSPLMYRAKEDDFCDTVEEAISYPVVIKQSYGSMGRGVFLARNRAELVAVRENLKLLPHLYQEHVGASYGLDLRVIVVGGSAIAAMRRENRGDFRSNLELGGTGTACELTEAQRAVAERAARVLGADYCGVDLIPDGEKTYLCEVNSNAFFLGITRVTGVNVAEAYAAHVEREIYK